MNFLPCWILADSWQRAQSLGGLHTGGQRSQRRSPGFLQLHKALLGPRRYRHLHSNRQSNVLTWADGEDQSCFHSLWWEALHQPRGHHHQGKTEVIVPKERTRGQNQRLFLKDLRGVLLGQLLHQVWVIGWWVHSVTHTSYSYQHHFNKLISSHELSSLH